MVAPEIDTKIVLRPVAVVDGLLGDLGEDNVSF